MAAVAERRIVAVVWRDIEHFLKHCGAAVNVAISNLASMLPDLATLSEQELPELAQLHLGSARNLMTTLRLMAPAAFTSKDASEPDLSVLEELDSSLLNMASTLIELQLFHLTRAAALTARSRALRTKQRLCYEQASSNAASSVLRANSSLDGSCSDVSVHMQFLDF